jgi:hypothetical protein
VQYDVNQLQHGTTKLPLVAGQCAPASRSARQLPALPRKPAPKLVNLRTSNFTPVVLALEKDVRGGQIPNQCHIRKRTAAGAVFHDDVNPLPTFMASDDVRRKV